MRLWILVSVLVLASCTKKEPERAPVEAAEVEAARGEAPVEEAPEAEAAGAEALAGPWDSWGEPGVTLITSGKAPLRKLRRTFKKGRKATVDLQVKGGADVETMSLSYVVSLETIEVSEDGAKATVALRVDEPAVLEGVRGQYTVDMLGAVADLDISPPADADPQRRSAVGNLAQFLLPVLAVRLPEEDVGEGAQWSVFETIERGPDVTIAVRSIYELTKLDGSTVGVDLTFEEAAKKSAPGPMTLLALQGTGSGAASFDLGKIVLDTAKRESSRKEKFAAGDSGQVFRMAIKTTTLLTAR
jgi:hypothetical protein